MISYDFLYDKRFFDKEINNSARKDKKLGCKIVKNGTILPFKKEKGYIGGGIVTEDECFLMDTSVHYGYGRAYEFNKDLVKHNDETVIYLGMWLNCWGHWLTDNISRLWFLKSDEYKNNFASCRILYVPHGDFKFIDNVKQLFKCLGFNTNDFVSIKELCSFSEIIIPDQCFFTSDGDKRFFTDDYIELIEEIRKFEIPEKYNTYDKVYFTCSKFATDKQIGEQRLEHFFRDQGYKIIAPETISFIEQLYILDNCKCFASTVGSSSHNIIFLNKGTDVVLIPRSNYLTAYQSSLDHVKDLNINYIDSSLSLFTNQKHPWSGPFYYYVSDELRIFFCVSSVRKGLGFNYWDFILYTIISFEKNIKNGAVIRPTDYYINILFRELLKHNNNSIVYRAIRKIGLFSNLTKLINRVR